MNYFWRLFLSAIVACVLTFSTDAAQASPILNHQITASEFLKLGVDKILHSNYQEAIEDLNQAIQLQSNFGEAYSDRCLAYLQLQDYHQAIADCTQAINFTPNNAEAYLNRGLASYRQKDYAAATADYHRAIALKPYEFRGYYNLALVHAAKGNYSQAIVDYNLALGQISQPTNILLADIYNDRGLARLQLQDLEAAMVDFSRAIHLDANDYRAYFNRGCACGRKGDNFGALRDFSKVIKLKPDSALAYVNRGVTRYHLGYYQGAIADLQTASRFFGHTGEKLACQKALDLLKTMQKQIPSVSEFA
ncbi:MAG: tetratricopeptide repeat protein [Aulosira sp. ZfuVER01]|nr:tetratricopeptide repeat protein [Aulosira sp. ZfuVER01]MDZ7999572.1 tetratricopeptide repeat protein [Aulosira sp. DedVER01a]MDZ8053987.1 tetratricopeptide repeat protein [Aulosira sp. ZfuCHP01]